MSKINKVNKIKLKIDLYVFILILSFIIFYLKDYSFAKSINSNCNCIRSYCLNNYYPNNICITYKYIEYKSNDTNYNHPNALYPIRAVELYPIYNSNTSSNYILKYKTICYPSYVYYNLFFNNYYKSSNSISFKSSNSSRHFNYLNYSNFYYSNSQSYSTYYYNYYDPYYFYQDNHPIKIQVKKIGYYDYNTGEYKESSF
jgi:hypothetical protein